MSNEWMKNGYLLITYYLLLITSESPCVHAWEYVKIKFDEHAFGMLRHYQRPCTGRKVAPSSLVIRGSVKLACTIATKLHSFTASDLAQVDIDTWLELRSQLQKHYALPELNNIDFAETPRVTWLI